MSSPRCSPDHAAREQSGHLPRRRHSNCFQKSASVEACAGSGFGSAAFRSSFPPVKRSPTDTTAKMTDRVGRLAARKASPRLPIPNRKSTAARARSTLGRTYRFRDSRIADATSRMRTVASMTPATTKASRSASSPVFATTQPVYPGAFTIALHASPTCATSLWTNPLRPNGGYK